MVTTEAYLAAVCESALTMERPPYVLRSQGLDLPSEWRAMGRILGPNPGDDLAVLEMARPRLAARLKSWELRPGNSLLLARGDSDNNSIVACHTSVVSYAMVPSSQLEYSNVSCLAMRSNDGWTLEIVGQPLPVGSPSSKALSANSQQARC